MSSFYIWKKKFLPACATPELARMTITHPTKRAYHRRAETCIVKSETTSHFGVGQKMIIEIKTVLIAVCSALTIPCATICAPEQPI